MSNIRKFVDNLNAILAVFDDLTTISSTESADERTIRLHDRVTRDMSRLVASQLQDYTSVSIVEEFNFNDGDVYVLDYRRLPLILDLFEIDGLNSEIIRMKRSDSEVGIYSVQMSFTNDKGDAIQRSYIDSVVNRDIDSEYRRIVEEFERQFGHTPDVL